jgi:drug/metabolite transporter (DMT)-like permease
MATTDQDRPLAGILWMLATGLSFVVVTGAVRHVGTDLPAAQSAFIRFLFGLVFLMPSLVPVLRRGLPAGAWPLVLGRGGLHVVAVFATFGHYAMARAFAAAPLTVTQPVTFLQLVWASLLGWLAFDEAVDPFVLLGGAMIIAAISYMTWREATARRRAITPPADAAKL